MRINLNSDEFTKDNVRKLIASGDDSANTQFRVTTDGILFLSKEVGNRNLDGIKFRLETNGANNGYVGKEAAENDDWVERIFDTIHANWPVPISSFIDSF